MVEYSEAELNLFRNLGFTDRNIENLNDYPFRLYRNAVEKCFLENLSGPAVEALRRAIRHLNDGKFRRNDGFDALIRLEK